MTAERQKAIDEWLDVHCRTCTENLDRGTDFVNCQAECEVEKDVGIACIHYDEYVSDTYWNEEDDDVIICPYCKTLHRPSYDDTYIGGVCVDCYDEGNIQTVTCDECGKKFTIEPYQHGWYYKTETIDGEMTEDEWEEKYG